MKKKWRVKRSRMMPGKYIVFRSDLSPGYDHELEYFDTWSEAMDYADYQRIKSIIKFIFRLCGGHHEIR